MTQGLSYSPTVLPLPNLMTQRDTLPRIAFLLDNLSGGGAERVILNLAGAFAELNHQVDLLVCEMQGSLCGSLPDRVNVQQLEGMSRSRGLLAALAADPVGAIGVIEVLASLRKVPTWFRYIPAVAGYLSAQRPAVLVSALPKANINAVLAKLFSGSAVRVLVGAHNHLSQKVLLKQAQGKNWHRSLRPLMRRCYQRADAVVAVSKGVADDICEFLGLDSAHVSTIYNPIVNDHILSLAEEAAGHPWFDSADTPILLGIGRFVPQKNFPLLLRAFARVRQQIRVRLVLLGCDEIDAAQIAHKRELTALAAELGVIDDVDFPGFAKNPYAFLRRSSLFVMSSNHEGFGNVLVEAMACGCPVVSTDCPSGPAEILADGQYGRLVPVGEESELAEAIIATLASPADPSILRERAWAFSVEKAVCAYRELMFGKQC